ncbi:hypothetical protein V7152_11300 [Neobacillus drentensis]|uniref:hypothetical protein n=1 Tax=Neobacillus drentensis TaxID=220684 RepID=UPI002FFE35A8
MFIKLLVNEESKSKFLQDLKGVSGVILMKLGVKIMKQESFGNENVYHHFSSINDKIDNR